MSNAAPRFVWAATMSFLKITERVKSPVNAYLYDLLHGGSVTLGGREIRLEALVLPQAVRAKDCIVWTFAEPIKVSTPGPDSRVSEIRQYRDRILLTVWPWAEIRIEFE
jgi:hypothetical protein